MVRLLDRAPMDFLGIDGTSKGKVAASGSDKKTLATTYVAMLSSMHMITDGQSESIAARYPTLRSLISAFEAQPDLRARERLLVGLPVSLVSFFRLASTRLRLTKKMSSR